MKKTFLLFFCLLCLLLSACSAQSQQNLEATLVPMQVQLTVQADELGRLRTQQTLPTPTCPVCPTPAPQPTQACPVCPSPVPSTPTATASAVGSISGTLSYPSEGIPPLRVIAFNLNTGYYYWQTTVLNQQTFRFDDLPVGSYHVLAYPVDGNNPNLCGAYSQAALCTTSGCTDHSLVEVKVLANQETKNIAVTDWYNPDPKASGWPADPIAKK